MAQAEQFPKMYLYRRLVQAKLYMDRYYYDAINLDDIADEAYFSRYHFIRQFKTIYGKTPHQYLMSVRIEQARLQLKTGKRVTEVCYAVGFESISSFSRLFKRINQYSPALYQQMELERKAEMLKLPLKFIPNCFAIEKGWV